MSLLRPSLTRLPKPSVSHTPFLTITQSFHSPSPLNAQPRRSPRVKAKSQPAGSIRIPRSQHPSSSTPIEASIPRLSQLQTAFAEGTLDAEPSHAVDFLHDFMKGGSSGFEEQLCKKHDISPLALFHLATLLVNPSTPPIPNLTRLAKTLMTLSYTLGCKLALYTLIYSALRNNTTKISTISQPLAMLKRIVETSNPPDSTAMTLLALVLKSQGRLQEALSYTLAATKWPVPSSAPEPNREDLLKEISIDFPGANEAFLTLGELFLQVEPSSKLVDLRTTAQSAFAIAAMDLNDPEGCYQSALLSEKNEMKGQLASKAAASGVEGAFGIMAGIRGEMQAEWQMLAEENEKWLGKQERRA